jgi:hypothetical protein
MGVTMTPQETKAFLDSLNRIAKAIEGKSDNSAVEVVNRFSEVFRMLQALNQNAIDNESLVLSESILEIMKVYTKIANKVMNEN